MQIRIRSKSRTIWLFIAASLVFHAALFFGLRELKPDFSEEEPQGPLKIRSLLIPEWEREEGTDQAARAAQAEEQEERQEKPRPEEQPDRSRREAPAEERPDAAERPEADPESRVAEALGGWDPDLGTGFEEEGQDGRGPGGYGGTEDGKQVPFSRLSEGRDLEVPEYPELARKWGWQGVVVLRIDVGPEGGVLGTEVIESSGYEILDKAAVDTVESAWSFRPPGEFVSTIKEIEFVLREGS